ncbi:hypothetical protein BJ138DRAFT_1112387 [Hygrophoropsis aurantiaca]|uniref:Uncharacterized protein n=1 Tax=Hygrophoropsis aurantiaca TaxID=72124 RepID=A0ACB8AFK1_9AGAM|nr:hypothetical protein BJ138DRAFT_1112387 [Hygrophoropsis aurantiaca]
MSYTNANPSVGALQIGGFTMIFLFGIVSIQVYHYYRKYTGDSVWLKSLVACVWCFELAHSITVAAGMYTTSVTNFGKATAETLDPLPPGFLWSVLCGGFIGPVVQAFFAHRVYIFSKQIYLPMLYWTTCFLRLVGTLFTSIYIIRSQSSLQDVAQTFGWLIKTILVVSAVSDTLVAISMCYYLKRERSLAIGRTAKLLDRLMTYTIETGVFTSWTEITILICFMKEKTNLAWFGVYLILAEVYANALMANLNARRNRSTLDDAMYLSAPLAFIASGRTRSQGSRSIPLKDIAELDDDALAPRLSNGMGDKVPAPEIVIAICQETQVERDGPGASREHPDALLE